MGEQQLAGVVPAAGMSRGPYRVRQVTRAAISTASKMNA
jgi:hypothetical protein